MIHNFRKIVRSKTFRVFLILIGVSFAFWGVQALRWSSGPGRVTVNGQEVSLNQLSSQQDMMAQVLKLALVQHLNAIDLQTDIDVLTPELKKQKKLMMKLDKAQKIQAYHGMMSQWQQQQWTNALLDSPIWSNQFSKDMQAYLGSVRTYEVLTVPLQNNKPKKIRDADLKAYYQTHILAFQKPARYQLSYFSVPLASGQDHEAFLEHMTDEVYTHQGHLNELAAQFHQKPQKTSTLDMVALSQGQRWVGRIQKASLAPDIQSGKLIADPVMMDDGMIYIYRVNQYIAPEHLSFNQAKSEIRKHVIIEAQNLKKKALLKLVTESLNQGAKLSGLKEKYGLLSQNYRYKVAATNKIIQKLGGGCLLKNQHYIVLTIKILFILIR